LVGLGARNEAEAIHYGRWRCAGDDAEMLAFEPFVREFGDGSQIGILLHDQRVGRAVIVIGVEHHLVALRVANNEIAGFRE